jgi:hypothetical protein
MLSQCFIQSKSPPMEEIRSANSYKAEGGLPTLPGNAVISNCLAARIAGLEASSQLLWDITGETERHPARSRVAEAATLNRPR